MAGLEEALAGGSLPALEDHQRAAPRGPLLQAFGAVCLGSVALAALYMNQDLFRYVLAAG